MGRPLTDRQLQELEEWADRASKVLEADNGDDCMVVGRSRLELLDRLISAERARRKGEETGE